jgi:hypothetical protein
MQLLEEFFGQCRQQPVQCYVKGTQGFLSSCSRLFLSEIPTEKVKWHKVWEFWWPKSTSDNVITEEVTLKKPTAVVRMGSHPILLNPARQ